MREVYRLVRLVAPTEQPVMVVGETGTGKELVARAVHVLSHRHDGPFVPVNAAAIPETLFESELFGHERGAFSEAREARAGLLEAAHHGTVVLDELVAMPPGCQAKLLRVIEEGVARRAGGVTPRPAAPRWVAASQVLAAGSSSGNGIRPDLWYRLAGVVIVLPPLRDRRCDVPILVNRFLEEQGSAVPWQVDPKALELLVSAPWLGNVRQLRQMVGRLVLAARDGRITAEAAARELSAERVSDGAARLALQEVLEEHGWNVRAASLALGVARSTLYRRLQALGLPRPGRFCLTRQIRPVSQSVSDMSRDNRDTRRSTPNPTPDTTST